MRLQSLVATCAVSALATCAVAVEDDIAPAGELRLLLGASPAYEISEDSESGGSETTYEWEGTDNDTGTVAIQYVRECGQPMSVLGQPILGLEILWSGAEQVPTSYTVDGATFGNAGGEKFTYLAMTPTAIAGWRFAKPESSELGLVGELQFLLGLTVLTGEVRNQLGSDRSIGFGFETGARVMFGIQEDGWTGGVLAGVRRGWASLDIDGDTYTSTLNLDRIGAELMLVVGHSF